MLFGLRMWKPQRCSSKGWRLSAGDKVGYVVLAGKGPLYARVMPYVFAQKDQADVDYYVTNQVLPAAARILSYFNVTQKDLELKTKEEKTRSLTDYLLGLVFGNDVLERHQFNVKRWLNCFRYA